MWRDIAFLLTILLNLFIIISYSGENGDNTEGKEISKRNRIESP